MKILEKPKEERANLRNLVHYLEVNLRSSLADYIMSSRYIVSKLQNAMSIGGKKLMVYFFINVSASSQLNASFVV